MSEFYDLRLSVDNHFFSEYAGLLMRKRCIVRKRRIQRRFWKKARGNRYRVQYMFLNPLTKCFTALHPKHAAIQFLVHNGGKQGNFGRCVRVYDKLLQKTTTWALIYDDEQVHQIDEKGNIIG